MVRLLGAVLVIEDDEADTGDEAERDQWRAVRQFIEAVDGAVVISGRQRRWLSGRPLVTYEIAVPLPEEQRDLWADALSLAADDPLIRDLAGTFSLGAGAIRSIAVAGRVPEALADGEATTAVAAARRSAIWDAARTQLRPRLETLAQRVEGRAGWDDLVLAPRTFAALHEVADQARAQFRGVVRNQWGFGRSARGQAVVALFAGGPGTGKTLAAEVIANEIGHDLYRIDLSAVVDKFIGETEKNLARLFDAAETGAPILFFDEADVLFGKRTEVKDARDRYANIEVGYLLQRLETYRGLAILSTNMREALDTAFLRRIGFMIDFGYPDQASRARLWRIAFPPQAPLDDVDFDVLAELQFSGGQIAAIAVNAAYLAAAAGAHIGMSHVLAACRQELTKASQPPDHPLLKAVVL